MRPSTPPPSAGLRAVPATPPNVRTAPVGLDVTPEQVKRMQIERMKAKAVQNDRSESNEQQQPAKRQRMNEAGKMERGTIQQSSYIEYNLDKIKDSKGGFMVEEDALQKSNEDRLKKIEESL